MNYIYNLKNKELSVEQIKSFYGDNDHNLLEIESNFVVSINANGEMLTIVYEDEGALKKTLKLFDILVKKVKDFEEIDQITLNSLINNILTDEIIDCKNVRYVTTYNGVQIKPLNKSQFNYFNILKNSIIAFASGAAGTGKTFLAVCYAVDMLKSKLIDKIIITRPIVEAGESLGFLPGEVKEKVDPYLIPIYDALNQILGLETTRKYIESQKIEIAPLAYMRGRTLNAACIILDEAQNTTITQMKMFLTRLGHDSKMIVTGDESQIDLKSNVKSGFIHALEILKGIKSIGFIEFSTKDVIRHNIVSKIIEAYNKDLK